jgi:hypothetical protein
MKPPPGGATLIDPKLRNSHEWPKWLASKETQQQLHGKKILTFCTGGIRCERATALINQIAVVSTKSNTNHDDNGACGGENDDKNKDDATPTNASLPTCAPTPATTFQPQGVYHMRGGIERYLKTFPKVR